MRRVPPSVFVREELDRLLGEGADQRTNIVSALVDTVTRLVVQQLLEAEQADYLGGRGRYERRASDQVGSRNGYEPGRLRTAEGAIGVRVPQVRGSGEPYRSGLMSLLEGNSEVLDWLVTEMYARGLSTRDVEDAFRDATGELLISKTAVSEITDRLWEDYQAFIARDLSDVQVEYLFCDAIFESLRAQGAKEALLVAWCIASDGRKHLLHLAVGNKESETCWTSFFRDMVDRGLRMPTTVTTDGAPGLVNAVQAVFDRSIRIRCWFHRLANIRAKLPAETASEVLAHVYAVRDAPTLDAARAAADRVANTFAREYPAAVACLVEDLDALLRSTGFRYATGSGSEPRTWPSAPSRRSAAARRSSRADERAGHDEARVRHDDPLRREVVPGLGQRSGASPTEAASYRPRPRSTTDRRSRDATKETTGANGGMKPAASFTGELGLDHVLVEDPTVVDSVRPDENVAIGFPLLAVAVAAHNRCMVCNIRPVRHAPRCGRCFYWRPHHNGTDWDGRLFKIREDGPQWPLRLADLAENQV